MANRPSCRCDECKSWIDDGGEAICGDCHKRALERMIELEVKVAELTKEK